MTQAPFRGMCEWCGKEIWAHRCAVQRTGWTLERQAGGANAIQGPDKVDTGKVMHEVCHMEALHAEQRGTHRNQMTMAAPIDDGTVNHLASREWNAGQNR